MSYFTVKKAGKDEFIEKKSTFIGHCKRVNTEEAAKAFINEIRSHHREARHNVYGYIIGENQGIQRYSDDGEPQGTGGIPVLEVIKKSQLTDVVVVVTRYFGGVLLGAGGLTRAYTKGASLAIKAGGIVEKVYAQRLTMEIDYELLGKLQYLIDQNNWCLKETVYGERVLLRIIAEDKDSSSIEKELTALSRGKVPLIREKPELFFKEGFDYWGELD